MSRRTPTKRPRTAELAKPTGTSQPEVSTQPAVSPPSVVPSKTAVQTAVSKQIPESRRQEQISEMERKRRKVIDEKNKAEKISLDDIPLFQPDDKLSCAENVRFMEERAASELAENLLKMTEEKANLIANRRMQEIRCYENFMYQESLRKSELDEIEDPKLRKEIIEQCIEYLKQKAPYKV